MHAAAWTIDATKILTRAEIASVVRNLKLPPRRRWVNNRQNLVIFRLATCCGLRCSEIAGLKMGDVRVGTTKPHLRLPKALTKGGKARKVPLWWDGATLADITGWKDERLAQEAGPGDYFVCVQADGSFGNQLHRNGVRNRWLSAIKVLGQDRVADLTIHDGRHSFASHSLAGGRSLAEVRDALGHASVAVTSVYTHVVDDDGQIGDLFAFDA